MNEFTVLLRVFRYTLIAAPLLFVIFLCNLIGYDIIRANRSEVSYRYLVQEFPTVLRQRYDWSLVPELFVKFVVGVVIVMMICTVFAFGLRDVVMSI